MLRDLLDDHPSLSVLPAEGSFITSLEKQLQLLPVEMRCSFMCKEWIRRLANPIDQPPYWMLGRSSQNRMPYIYFARAFITWWNFFSNKAHTRNNLWPLTVVQLAYACARNRYGGYSTANYLVEKTPANERNIERLWQQFPEAKIIHIIRNPAHVLSSRKKLEPCTPLRIFLRDLRMSFKIAAEQQNKKDSRYLLLRYEDLCRDPFKTTECIASFLGIQSLPCLLNPTVAGKPAKANSSFTSNAEYGEILDEEEHKQKNMLTAHELKLLSASIGNTAFGFGYTLPSVAAVQKLIIRSINRIW